MRDQRVVRAIADIGLGRQFRLLAALLGHFGDVLGVVEPGRVERLRDHRHQKLDRVEPAPCRGALVPGERIALDLDDLVPLDDAVGFAAVRLVSEPAHRFPPCQNRCPAMIAETRIAGPMVVWRRARHLSRRQAVMRWRGACRGVHIVVACRMHARSRRRATCRPRSRPATRTGNEEPLLLEALDGGVLRLTLNRPAARNALSLALMGELRRALDEAAADRECRVVVIAGAGPAFCAGHDLRELRSDPSREAYERIFAECSALMQQIVALPKPVIAEVHGIATAAGCQLVATCDLAVAAEDARFATPGVNIGLFCSTPMVALDPRRRAQAGDGNAADRRADRRRDGEGDRAGQPGRARRRAERGDPGTGPADRGQIGVYGGDRQGGVLSAGRNGPGRCLSLCRRGDDPQHAGARCRRRHRRVSREAACRSGRTPEFPRARTGRRRCRMPACASS